MKSAMVYVLALSLLLTALLSGCGDIRGSNGRTDLPTASPEHTILPDPEDGEVRDSDGIITEDDSGTLPQDQTGVPETTANPGSGMTGGENGNSHTNSTPSAKR